MTMWSAEQLLDLWERGATRHLLDRALLMFATARSGMSLRELADLPIGERDQALLELRCTNFGRQLPSYVDCPACMTRLEFMLDGESLRCPALQDHIDVDGVRFRAPTSNDLAIALDENDPATALRSLVLRCMVMDGDLPERALTADRIARLEAAMADADSAADIVLDFACEQCGHTWSSVFDIAAYLWQEVDVRARQLLHDVHLLAQAYGWNERDVLALSDARRAAYIDMVNA